MQLMVLVTPEIFIHISKDQERDTIMIVVIVVVKVEPLFAVTFVQLPFIYSVTILHLKILIFPMVIGCASSASLLDLKTRN